MKAIWKIMTAVGVYFTCINTASNTPQAYATRSNIGGRIVAMGLISLAVNHQNVPHWELT